MSEANIYRVVYAGEVIPGFDPEEVKLAAGERLKAAGPQIDRLFCGRKVIIKKDISAEAASRYLIELRKLGMVVRLERRPPDLPMPEPGVRDDSARFRVISRGQLLEGYEPLAVRQATREMLRLTSAQQVMLFSGRKVQLRRDLKAEEALRLAEELAGVGLIASVEEEAPSIPASPDVTRGAKPPVVIGPDGLPVNPESTVVLDSAALTRDLPGATETRPATPAVAAPPAAAPEATPDGLMATQVVNADALSQYLGTHAEAPTVEVINVRGPEATLVADGNALGQYLNDLPQLNETVTLTPPPDLPETAQPAMQEIDLPDKQPAQRAQFVRCSQCGIKQSRRARCVACGARLDGSAQGPVTEPKPDKPQRFVVPPAPFALDEPTVMALPDMFGDGTPAVVTPPKRNKRPSWGMVALLAVGLLALYVIWQMY